ncbi:unnamed protein product [Nesidiocoris tenuis]|uniref:Uncharacterized protein n=1 Tax=Nesidiocoris tenuis TaxID=355587 RepID=A0A6H5GTG8_9HEMI|nr:unnamed protein product [Nesidiocoris tenuis]
MEDSQSQMHLSSYDRNCSKSKLTDSGNLKIKSTGESVMIPLKLKSTPCLASQEKIDSYNEIPPRNFCKCPDEELLEKQLSETESLKPDLLGRITESSAEQEKRCLPIVERSPYERRDKTAKLLFIKELGAIERKAVERKLRVKPKEMKKHPIKESVYENIRNICQISDTRSDNSLRKEPSWPSIAYGANGAADDLPDLATSDTVSEEASSIHSVRIKLLKRDLYTNVGGTGGLTREEAFREIELSEEEETEGREMNESHTSSSDTELLSSDSEISVRVNLDRKPSTKCLIRRRTKNTPFLKLKENLQHETSEKMAEAHKSSPESPENAIIDKIATEFGAWAEDNGLRPETVEKDVIKELFEFGTMNMAANSISIEIKELIIVPQCINIGQFPELEERAAMYRQILFDELVHWKTERSMAFGKPDPRPYKRPPIPPIVEWTSSEFVPTPLATGELLYQPLIDNESLMLEKFVLWLIQNPNLHRPLHLMNSGYFQKIIDKHGGSEAIIRERFKASKSLSFALAKHLITSKGPPTL